jgi:phage shock protein E
MMSVAEIVRGENKTFIDVRSEGEFIAGHIEGAINIPLPELRFRVDEIEKMQKPIVVYCLSGGRSTAAMSLLMQAGIDEVYNGGGIGDMQYMLAAS